MGADIHLFTEKRIGKKWVMINRLYDGPANSRNYARFAKLAGVRGDGPEPKGIPSDISDSGKLFIDDWYGDGHSHSYMGAKEAAQIFLETDGKELTGYEQEHAVEHYFNIRDSHICDCTYRVVFFFDN